MKGIEFCSQNIAGFYLHRIFPSKGKPIITSSSSHYSSHYFSHPTYRSYYNSIQVLLHWVPSSQVSCLNQTFSSCSPLTTNWAIPESPPGGIWYFVVSQSWSSCGSLLSSLQPELAHPYDVLAPHTQITIASPAGGEAPLDPSSIDKSDKVSANFLDTKEALWKNTEKLSSFVGRAKEFDAIFYVGGHGREPTLPYGTLAIPRRNF